MSDLVEHAPQVAGHRVVVLGTLAGTIIAVEGPRYIVLLPGCGSWGGALTAISHLLMVTVPFAIAWAVPNVASFDRQWIPRSAWHWIWFFGMVVTLLGVGRLSQWLISLRGDWFILVCLSRVRVDISPAAVVISGVLSIVLAPIAEEVFWRGYALTQLRKLAGEATSLSIHSLLFTIAHVPSYWPHLLDVFVTGAVLGLWRLRFQPSPPRAGPCYRERSGPRPQTDCRVRQCRKVVPQVSGN